MSARADESIRRATIETLLAQGWGAFSIERVAAASGVAKTTIYRRFSGKAELVGAALAATVNTPPAPDTGSFAGDVKLFFSAEFEDEGVMMGVMLLPRLLGEAAFDPALLAILRRVLIEPREEMGRAVVRRAIERGELRAGLDPDDVIDALVGPVINRLMTTGADPVAMAGFPERLIDMVIAGLAPR